MRVAPFLEDFVVWRQGVPFLSARFVRVPIYIRGALRTTRPTSLVPATPTWGQTRPTLRFMGRRTSMENRVSNRDVRMGMVSFGMGCGVGWRWRSRQRRSQAARLTESGFESGRSLLFSNFSFTHPENNTR